MFDPKEATMRTYQKIILAIVLPALASWLNAAPMGTAFNYQGYLTVNGNGANGQYDMRFELYDDATLTINHKVGPTITRAPVDVSKGLFTTNIDFGSGIFDGKAYWLEVAVRPNGSVSSYVVQSPRVQIRPVPNALFAATADTANSANGVAANAVNGTGIQNNSITANKISSGQVVKSLNGLRDDVTLSAGAGITLGTNGNSLSISANSGSDWSLTGNSGTSAGPNFLGTIDNQPLQLKAFNNRGLELETVGRGDFFSSESSLNLLGGSPLNYISDGVIGGTVSGGGGSVFAVGSSFEFPNRVTGDFGSVGGGENNAASQYATVPGGSGNTAAGQYSFAAGRSARANHDGSFVWNSYNRAANSFAPSRFHVFAQNGFSVDYDVQRPDGGGAHWAGFGVSPGQTLSTWTGAFLEDNGDWHSRYVIAYGEGNELAYLGGDGVGADVQIGSLNPGVANVAAYNPATGQYMNMFVRTLTIMGGADLAEPFQMSHADISEGSVVIIDEEHPGQLKQSTQPYDTRVAGVVSGANGVNPGLSLRQEGRLDGGQNVALTGRVYVLADASYGAIKPGDLLTTSSTPGHAMKVTDHTRAQGAVLGKAMSTLAEGKDTVLVLVTLQ
jgi:hypothetical protein